MDEKESRHWLESYQDSCALQAQMPDSLLVNLADREGDIYEWFAEYQDYVPAVRAEWIVRATQNRRLLGAPEDTAKCLWFALEQAPVVGQTEVNVKPRPNRAARLAHITLHAATVTLKPPTRLGYRLPALKHQRGTGA